MELKHLRLIKTIAEEGSLANSSEKLFLTQSALSHQLKDLEEQLGFKLFVRSRNKWTPTQEGEKLLELARDVLERISTGLREVNAVNQGSHGTIRISSECYAFYKGLAKFIQGMGVMYPEISIEIMLEATCQTVQNIKSGSIDAAIITGPANEDELASTPLFEDEIMAIMHVEHPLADREYLTARDFSNVHLIIHSYPMSTVAVHQLLLGPNGISPKRISAIPMTQISLEMIGANMGVACMPEWFLEPFRLSNEIVLKRITKTGLMRTNYLAYRKADRCKKFLNDFILNMQDDFQVL